MTKIDDQPFRSRAERERDRELAARYKALGNPELIAELPRQPQQQQDAETSVDRRQQG